MNFSYWNKLTEFVTELEREDPIETGARLINMFLGGFLVVLVLAMFQPKEFLPDLQANPIGRFLAVAVVVFSSIYIAARFGNLLGKSYSKRVQLLLIPLSLTVGTLRYEWPILMLTFTLCFSLLIYSIKQGKWRKAITHQRKMDAPDRGPSG